MRGLLKVFPLKHLDPKECFISRTPTLVSTVLGSCVAVTMFEPKLVMGGVCHAFLPRHSEYADVRISERCAFMDTALDYMFEEFAKQGADLEIMEFKLFGGGGEKFGGELPPLGTELSSVNVAARNVVVAREVFRKKGLRFSAEDVGGSFGRKLLFLTHTGGAWIKRWPPKDE